MAQTRILANLDVLPAHRPHRGRMSMCRPWPCASASSNTTFTTTSRATSLYVPLVYGFTSQRRPTPIKPKENRAEDESTHTTFRINDIRAPQPRQPRAGLCHVRMRGIRIRGDACARREHYLEARVSCGRFASRKKTSMAYALRGHTLCYF